MKVIASEPDLRLVQHTGKETLELLPVLEEISNRDLSWVADGRSLDRLHIVIASRTALVIGFVIVDAAGGLMRIRDTFVVPQVTDRPVVLGALVEAGLDAAESAWGDVEIRFRDEAVSHLLKTGWQPIEGAQEEGTITLSGIGVA